MFAYPFVDAAVVTAYECEGRFFRQSLRLGLAKRLALGRQQYDGARPLSAKHRVDGLEQGLRLEEHPGTTAVAVVINRMVAVLGVVSEVVNAQVQLAIVHGAADHAVAEGAVEHVGEQGEDVDLHGL